MGPERQGRPMSDAAPADHSRGYALPGQLTVREGLERYLAQNGFSIESYTAPTFALRMFGRLYHFPNTRDRQRLVPFHDLHHVLTGYGTDFMGEAEIGAWELRSGCKSFAIYYLDIWSCIIGLLIDPMRLFQAWKRAKGQRTLYRMNVDYPSLLDGRIGDLRAMLGIPPDGLAAYPPALHPDAPGLGAER